MSNLYARILILSKDTYKYYQSDDKNKPNDKTIKLYLKAKKLNKLQFGILFKSLRGHYLLSLGYNIEDLYIDKNEFLEDEFLRNNTKNIKVIDDDKINKLDEDFNESRAYENLRKFKTKMIIFIQILFSCLIYFLSQSLILVISFIIAIELIIVVINKKPTEKDFQKAKKEMDKIKEKRRSILYNKY